jgi:hypothetical protein
MRTNTVPAGPWYRYEPRYGSSVRTRRRHLYDIRAGLLRRIPGGNPDATQADLIKRRIDLEADLWDAKLRREVAYERATAADKPSARDAAMREAHEYERRVDDRRGKIELCDRQFAMSIAVRLKAAALPTADPLGALHGHFDEIAHQSDEERE